MTMLSFRIADEEAERISAWAERLGLDRSDLLREAVRRHLTALAAIDDIQAWLDQPLTDDESSLADIADWGPADDWSDWA